MERALVALKGDETDESLLEEARQYASGDTADLVVLMMVTEEEYEKDQDVLGTIAAEEKTSSNPRKPAEYARTVAKQTATDQLKGSDVEFDVVGKLLAEGEHDETILEVADEYGCDHVFLQGRRRSPTGKAIFGDTAQSVILNFDGYVTLKTGI